MKKLLIIPLLLIFAGCSLVDISGNKWKNTFIFFNPEELDIIYVSDEGMKETAGPQKNDFNYQVNWIQSGDEFTLEITSHDHPIHFAYFSGYDAENESEEIPWEKEDHTFKVTSNKLLPPTEGYYRISISEDLKR